MPRAKLKGAEVKRYLYTYTQIIITLLQGTTQEEGEADS